MLALKMNHLKEDSTENISNVRHTTGTVDTIKIAQPCIKIGFHAMCTSFFIIAVMLTVSILHWQTRSYLRKYTSSRKQAIALEPFQYTRPDNNYSTPY